MAVLYVKRAFLQDTNGRRVHYKQGDVLNTKDFSKSYVEFLEREGFVGNSKGIEKATKTTVTVDEFMEEQGATVVEDTDAAKKLNEEEADKKAEEVAAEKKAKEEADKKAKEEAAKKTTDNKEDTKKTTNTKTQNKK